MHVLAIDAGSYSVKYISSFVDKRSATHLAAEEHVIAKEMIDNPDWESVEFASTEIIKRIIDEVARPDTRIILHASPEATTTRFLTLPVKSRKKADMMIPFQLEEDIPYALHESHFSWSVEIGKSQSLALVALTRDSEFHTFHDRISQMEPAVSYVTSEPSIMDAFYFINQVAGPYCVLDIGHRSSKAYFFYNSKMIATHMSYVGGKHIDEMVAQTYGLGLAEAVEYKHQNAFVLTTAQAQEVDENQKEFARLMDQIFQPLINDFNKWELGFRVTHGIKIDQLFICGGSANIKNMPNYLTDRLTVKTVMLETFEGINLSNIDMGSKMRSKFTLTNMMALSVRAKNRLINLLVGRYALASRGELPLHSLAFVSTRAAAVTLVLALAFIVEGVMVDLDIKAVNTKLGNIAKNPILALTAKDRRQMINAPQITFASLGKRQRAIRQQITTLQSASDIKALSPLVAVSSAALGSKATLIEFNVTDTGDVTVIFSADALQELEELKGRLGSISLNNIDLQLDETKKTLTMTGIQ